MKRSAAILLSCLVASGWWLSLAQPIQAVTPTPNFSESATMSGLAASASATATASSQIATGAAQLEQILQDRQDKDITQPSLPQKSKLAAWLDENPIGPVSWHNFLQHAIRRAIDRGLPANIVVLILLFPVIASIISFSRHVIGMKGFGIYTPAVLSVAFVSTGIVNGILLFLVTLSAATLARKVIKRLSLHYLPRTAMLLWGVSVIVLATLIAATYIPFNFFIGLNIFPILIIILLTENFMESQLMSSQSAAMQLTLETLITAIVCSVIIGSDLVQRSIILQPELTLIVVAAVNMVVGRYTGLRLLEWVRFKSIIDE